MNKSEILLGVLFEIDHFPVDGFQLTLTNDERQEVLFDRRMVGYTEFEALLDAVAYVWATELENNGWEAYDLTLRIAERLNVEELWEEEED